MKKFVFIITLLALALSMCACFNGRVPTANAIEAPKSEESAEIVLHAGDFTVIKTEWSKYDFGFLSEDYKAVLEHNGKRVLVDIGQEQYACWDENDIVIGTLTLTPAHGLSDDELRLVIDEEEIIVRWSQAHDEMK